MATVRMSERLIGDIKDKARRKFANTNPSKELPSSLGEKVADDHDLTNKALATFKFLNEQWQGLYKETLFDYDRIIVTGEETYIDRYGDEDVRSLEFTLELNTPRQAPGFIVKSSYGGAGYMKVVLPYNDPVMAECIAVQNYNKDLSDKKYDFINNLENTIRKFTTLNQALKAAPAIKDLVPQVSIDTVYKKDDRTRRAAELAEIADAELTDLKEILLTDSLLGDD